MFDELKNKIFGYSIKTAGATIRRYDGGSNRRFLLPRERRK